MISKVVYNLRLALEQGYDWYVKLDDDVFVEPTTLARNIERWTAEGKVGVHRDISISHKTCSLNPRFFELSMHPITRKWNYPVDPKGRSGWVKQTTSN